jgi:flavodoxin
MGVKGMVVYDSSPGNNGMVAEAIMETLKSAGFEVDLFSANDVKKLNADNYDFLVVGGPARIGMMTFTMRCSIGGKIKRV